MPALVAPLWDDLEAIEGTGDTYFQTFGEAPNRYCVVEWHDYTFGHGTVQEMTLTFEVIFHENGDMVFVGRRKLATFRDVMAAFAQPLNILVTTSVLANTLRN